MIPLEIELLALCAALALGELGGFSLSRFGPCWPVAAALFVAVALSEFAFRWRFARPVAAFFGGAALALALSASRGDTVLAATVLNRGAPTEAEFAVASPVSVRPGGDGRWVSFRSRLGDVPVKVICPVRRGTPLPRVGERWRCVGWLSRTRSRGVSDERVFWVRGPKASARRVARADGASFAAFLRRTRRDLSRRIGIGLGHDPETANLNRAILIGERSRIGRGTKEAFVAAGTVHIFAISGLHVMVVARVLLFLMLMAGVPLRWSSLGVIPVLWLYVELIGAPPSAVRAAAMASLYCAAPLVWRRPNMLVACSLTFLAVHAIRPESLFDVGSLLSFAVMFGILLWGRRRRIFASRAADAVGFAFAAWAAGAPIAAHVFGRVTPGGLLANLVLVPAAGVGVVAGVLGALASYVSEGLAAHVNNFAALVTRLMAGVSRAVADLPGANFEVRPWTVGECLAWYAVFAMSVWLAGSVAERRRRTL